MHAHMSSFTANMSYLAKISDPETFEAVLKATAWPMIQINIPDCFLNLMMEAQPQMMAEEQMKSWRKCYFHAPVLHAS